MITNCPRCNAELGPWENPAGCRTCIGHTDRSIADRSISVLEQTNTPLAWWDVKRILDSQPREAVRPTTASQVLADDPRACWGGRGIYGLYRHGLLPGVRDLGRAAAVYIHASDRRLSLDEVRFILREVGYRSPDSLEPALLRVNHLGIFRRVQGWSPNGSWCTHWEGSLQNVRRQRAAADALRLGRRGPDLRAIISRSAVQADTALTERARRLI